HRHHRLPLWIRPPSLDLIHLCLPTRFRQNRYCHRHRRPRRLPPQIRHRPGRHLQLRHRPGRLALPLASRHRHPLAPPPPPLPPPRLPAPLRQNPPFHRHPPPRRLPPPIRHRPGRHPPLRHRPGRLALPLASRHRDRLGRPAHPLAHRTLPVLVPFHLVQI